MKTLLTLFFILPFVSATEYYCDRDRFPLVTDFSPDSCTGSTFYKEDIILGCFPGCQQQVTSIRSCDPEGLPCPPGYKCGTRNMCEIDADSCYRYYVSGSWSGAANKPTCLETDLSKWGPKQCKGETANGRCFCTDSSGNRIFGEAFSYEADDMTCACSSRRHELETAGNNVFVSLHCDSKGNYEALQCDVDSEQCWCVEPKTGDLTGIVLPMGLMTKLPCYNATQVGSQYLRQCESQLYAQSKITDEFSAHGTTRTNFLPHTCQYDGSYGPYKIENSIVYCVSKDNTALGYQVEYDSTISSINCRCALDKQIFTAAGLSHILTCLANGNYKALQVDGSLYYCVDDDGFIKSDSYSFELDCDEFYA